MFYDAPENVWRARDLLTPVLLSSLCLVFCIKIVLNQLNQACSYGGISHYYQ